jgi:hypothetical protein
MTTPDDTYAALVEYTIAATEADTASWAAETEATADLPMPLSEPPQFYDED